MAQASSLASLVFSQKVCGNALPARQGQPRHQPEMGRAESKQDWRSPHPQEPQHSASPLSWPAGSDLKKQAWVLGAHTPGALGSTRPA